jgi:hypothetical protein
MNLLFMTLPCHWKKVTLFESLCSTLLILRPEAKGAASMRAAMLEVIGPSVLLSVFIRTADKSASYCLKYYLQS